MDNPHELYVNKKLREMIFGKEEEEEELDKIGGERIIKEMSKVPEGGETPYYMDEQAGFTSIQYILKPDIPRKYYPEFRKFLLMIDKLTPLANISREDILRYKILFRMIVRWYKLGLPQVARRYQAEFLFEIQLSRAVGGFERMMQATTRQITIEEGASEAQPSKGGFLSRLFRGGG